MKLTKLLSMKRGWFPEHKVEFQELLPLKLKDSVSGKGEKGGENACVQQIMNLLACLKKHESSQAECAKEVETLNMCYETHRANKLKHEEQMKIGALTPGDKNLNHRQITMLLKQFPSPK